MNRDTNDSDSIRGEIEKAKRIKQMAVEALWIAVIIACGALAYLVAQWGKATGL